MVVIVVVPKGPATSVSRRLLTAERIGALLVLGPCM